MVFSKHWLVIQFQLAKLRRIDASVEFVALNIQFGKLMLASHRRAIAHMGIVSFFSNLGEPEEILIEACVTRVAGDHQSINTIFPG